MCIFEKECWFSNNYYNNLSQLIYLQVATHGGSVRMTTLALERLQYEQSNSGGSTGRAVENTYTYTWSNAAPGRQILTLIPEDTEQEYPWHI